MISQALSILKTDEERNILSELYSAYSKRFYAIAFQKLGNRAEAEDAVQEAFLRIATKPDGFFGCPAEKRIAYIDIVIRNCAIEAFRKKTRRETAPPDEDFPDPSRSVEDIVIGEISESRLADFIMTIPLAKREALQLRAFNHLSNREISEALGITEAAARKRISDAMKLIKDFVKGENGYE